MSSIAGFCNFRGMKITEGESIAAQMKAVLNHRGTLPETYINDGMVIVNAFRGADCVISLDGEIYNSDNIKKRLEDRGYNLTAASDEEIILSGFMEYGAEIVSMLNGVFSFVIFDRVKRRLFMFRDRFGQKPLFYTFQEGTLVFASEIKALFKFPGVKAQIDKAGLCEIFGIGPARTSGIGVFKNVREIRAGYFNVFTEYAFNEERFFEFVARPHNESYDETVEHVRFLLSDSVKKQAKGNVPITTMLSGGLDSSVVTALCATESQKPLETYSFDFVDNSKYFNANDFQPSEDAPYAAKVSELFGTKHKIIYCDYEELADSIYDSVLAKDLPGMADVDSSLLFFCKKIAKESSITLTGECSDEIFGGYPWFRKEENFDIKAFPWSAKLDFRKQLISKGLLEKLDLDSYVNMRYSDSINECIKTSGECEKETRRREISYLTQKWFMSTLIDRLDRASSHSGLTCRTPFSDYRLVDYLWNVPWEYKCRNGVVKGLLRDAAKGLLPDDILYRKKSPYPKTYNPNYERLLAKRLGDVLEDKTSPIIPLLDEDNVRRFMSSPADYGCPWFGQLMAAPQMLAYLLQINYWLKVYDVEILL